MVDVFAIRFVCAHSDTRKKTFYVTEGTEQGVLHVDEGIKFRTHGGLNDTLIFFSKTSANMAASELLKLCQRVHDNVENPEMIVSKIHISTKHAEYIANRPLHWTKKE